MSQHNEAERNKRIRDFRRRGKFEKPIACLVNDQIVEYISIHPMADEPDLLKRLNIKPIDCKKVDCYFLIDNDVIFVETQSSAFSEERPPGIYARWRLGDPMFHVMRVITEPFIDHKILEDYLAEIYLFINEKNLLTDDSIKEKYLQIDK